MKNLKFGKKWTALFLSLMMVLTLIFAGCGAKGTPANGTDPAQQTTSSVQEDEDAEGAEDQADSQDETTDGTADASDEENSGQKDDEADDQNGSADGQSDSSAKDSDGSGTEDAEDAAQYAETIDEDGSYTTKEDVALYLYTYGHLPKNFITKKEARKLGWSGGSLEEYAPGKCIGGDYFGNYEGRLPEKKGRDYHECDIDTLGAKKRGAKRIIYSDDGLIYYTSDHYETFELLYGEE